MTRFLSAVALLPIVCGVVWFLHPLATLILVEVILFIAFLEYADLATRAGTPFPKTISVVAALSTCAVLGLEPSMLPVMLMAVTVGIGVVQLSRWPQNRTLSSVSTAVFGVLYLALPLGSMVALRFRNGPELLFLLLVAVMTSDTTQYYGGRLLGRRALAPSISPKKTVEGALIGLAAGAFVVWGLGFWWLDELNAGLRVLLGLTVSGLGIGGDLFESSLKRNANLKDASHLIPGHGGLLDRLDGFLFAAPVYYTVVQFAR
jgi:phosphatidate cytidylyltransferase